MRGFVGGGLEGGGGGCEAPEDVVVSIDNERMGTKGDVIWRRDACSTVDNMMRVCMQRGMHLPAASVTVTYTAGSITCYSAIPRSDSERRTAIIFRRNVCMTDSDLC